MLHFLKKLFPVCKSKPLSCSFGLFIHGDLRRAISNQLQKFVELKNLFPF